MPTKGDRQALIAKIRELPTRVDTLAANVREDQLDVPGGEGEWTVRQVIHHLADSHLNAYIRSKLILTEDHPTLKPYDQEEWAKLPDSTELPIETSLQILKGLHARWTYLLERVRDDQWQRSAHHPENGEITLDDILETYANHGENHINQIKNIRAAQSQ